MQAQVRVGELLAAVTRRALADVVEDDLAPRRGRGIRSFPPAATVPRAQLISLQRRQLGADEVVAALVTFTPVRGSTKVPCPPICVTPT
jgi:hypothetical protein